MIIMMFTGSPRPCWYIISAIILFSLLGILVLYLAWPSIMYKFNLYHSKSLPYLGESFVGREREMQEVVNLVDFSNSDVRIVNIIGSPGFGKSTLAIHVGHEMVKKGDVVHYVNLADFPDTDVKTVLSEKIFDSARIIAKRVTFDRLLRWARERYYNNLFILDNCDDVLNIQMGEFQNAMRELVKESKKIKIILTSRKYVPALNYYDWFKVDKLNDAAAYTLIQSKVSLRVILTHEQERDIIERTGNVPLALQIVGSLLCLPNAPKPDTIIRELKVDPMTVLTPPDFPADEQMFTTIDLSYKYLLKDVKEIGRQLSIFPGSFTQQAAIKICGSQVVDSGGTSVAGALSNLAGNSLLEYNKRNDRYQYHQLIREYFLYVSKKHANETTRLQSAFHIYYAEMLSSKSLQYTEQFDRSLAILDSELHNIQHLFRADRLSSLPTIEFLVTAVALSKSINVGFLTVRFPEADLCVSVQVSLTRLDTIVDAMVSIQDNIHFLHEDISQQTLSKENILSHYLLLIHQMAACEEKANRTIAAGRVYIDRKSIVKNRSMDIDPIQYKDFFTTLSKYYSQQGNDQGVVECHRSILERTDAHLVKCERENQCNYYDIGVMYYSTKEYHKAADFFEKDLKKCDGNVIKQDIFHQPSFKQQNSEFIHVFTALDTMKSLMKLAQTYKELEDNENVASTLSTLLELQPQILNTCYKDFFKASVSVQSAIEFYRQEGLHDPATSLEERLIFSVKEVQLKGVFKAWCYSKSECEFQVPVNKAYMVIEHFYEVRNYSVTVELGMHYINALRKAVDFQNDVPFFQVLVGKALFYRGNYSEGMNQMELALQFIMKHNLRFQEQIDTACWYLIPRVKYIESCYSVSKVPTRILYGVSSTILFLLFSPFPLPTVMTTSPIVDEMHTSNFKSADQSTKHTKLSDTREMMATVHWLRAIPNVFVDQLWQASSSTATAYDGVQSLFTNCFIYAPLSLLKKIYHILYVPIWVLIVWMKLLWLLFQYKVCTKQVSPLLLYISVKMACYHCCFRPQLIFFVPITLMTRGLKVSQVGSILVLAFQYSRDPRFIYCDEDSPITHVVQYVEFLRSKPRIMAYFEATILFYAFVVSHNIVTFTLIYYYFV